MFLLLTLNKQMFPGKVSCLIHCFQLHFIQSYQTSYFLVTLNVICCLPKSMIFSYSKNKYFLYQSDRVFTISKMEAANKDCKLSPIFSHILEVIILWIHKWQVETSFVTHLICYVQSHFCVNNRHNIILVNRLKIKKCIMLSLHIKSNYV